MKLNLFPLGVVTALGVINFTAGIQAQTNGYQQAPGYPQQVQPPPQYQYRQPPPPGYQPGYAPPPPQTQYVSPVQFLPTFGRKFGDMFRRVFYGDAPPAGYNQQGYQQPQYQQPQYQQPPQGRLDQPPPGYYQQQPQYQGAPQYQQAPQYQGTPQQSGPPRYEAPPAPRNSAPAMPPTSRMGSSGTAPSTKKKSGTSTKNSSTPSPKYTPPSITREPSASPRVEEEPPPSLPPSTDSTPGKLPGSKPDSSTANTPKPGEDKPNASANSGSFLRGKKTGKEGRVISPYPPYRELDVSGLSSGSLALDPTTQKVFEVP